MKSKSADKIKMPSIDELLGVSGEESATETYTGCGNKAFYLGMYERLILSVLIDSDWSCLESLFSE